MSRPTEDNLVTEIIESILSVIGNEPTSLHEPRFDGREMEYLSNCISTTMVSSVGPYVTEFEEKISHFTNSRFAVAMCNGTSALHIALLAVGVKPQEEVLLSPLTFIATANAISYIGAIPHFVDCEESSFGIDAEKLRIYLKNICTNKNGLLVNKKTKRVIRAIVPMHCYGMPSRMDKITELAQEFSLHVVEDAAESLGSFYQDRHTGTIGEVGVISFNGNKIITTGGGGVVITDNSEIAEKARHLSTTARVRHSWNFEHDTIGYNYRMPNLNAALGLAQIEKIWEKIDSKRRLHDRYRKAFSEILEVSLLSDPGDSRSNYWLNTLLLNQSSIHLKERILIETNKSGISTRPAWQLLNASTPYRGHPSMITKCAEKIEAQIINIPSSEFLGRGIQ